MRPSATAMAAASRGVTFSGGRVAQQHHVARTGTLDSQTTPAPATRSPRARPASARPALSTAGSPHAAGCRAPRVVAARVVDQVQDCENGAQVRGQLGVVSSPERDAGRLDLVLARTSRFAMVDSLTRNARATSLDDRPPIDLRVSANLVLHPDRRVATGEDEAELVVTQELDLRARSED